MTHKMTHPHVARRTCFVNFGNSQFPLGFLRTIYWPSSDINEPSHSDYFSSIMTEQTGGVQISAATLKIPAQWTNDLAVWLHVVHVQFATLKITLVSTIFDYLLAALPPR